MQQQTSLLNGHLLMLFKQMLLFVKHAEQLLLRRLSKAVMFLVVFPIKFLVGQTTGLLRILLAW
jgi:hypothetical protein